MKHSLKCVGESCNTLSLSSEILELLLKNQQQGRLFLQDILPSVQQPITFLYLQFWKVI